MIYRFAHKILAPLVLCVLMVAGFSCCGQHPEGRHQSSISHLRGTQQRDGDIIYTQFDTTFCLPTFFKEDGQIQNHYYIHLSNNDYSEFSIFEKSRGRRNIDIFTVLLNQHSGYYYSDYSQSYCGCEFMQIPPEKDWSIENSTDKLFYELMTFYDYNNRISYKGGLRAGMQYIGLKCPAKDGKNIYGWIRVTADTDSVKLTLHDAAICLDPDAHFRVGQRTKRDKLQSVFMKYLENKSIAVYSTMGAIKQVAVVSLMGKEMSYRDIDVEIYKVTINYSRLPRGLYLARVLTSDGRVESVKFLVQ